MWWYSRTGFVILQVLQLLHSGDCNDTQWGHDCPLSCLCHISTYDDLPMKRWLVDTVPNNGSPLNPTLHPNEALYEDEAQLFKAPYESEETLKMAMCVFQQETAVDMLFDSLPSDTQVLTILQGRDSGNISLEASHMHGLEDLIALDIQGYNYEKSDHQAERVSSTRLSDFGRIILRSDALFPLKSLQYLNLQNIKILGSPGQGNRPAPVITPSDEIHHFGNSIPVGIWTKEQRKPWTKENRKESSTLVFLPPTETDGEILPYKVYVEKQERAGLSTFASLVNLLFLRVYSCGLKEVNWEMFETLNNLQYLSLESNNLLFIPDFTFYGTSNLKTLSLANNKLLSLHSVGLAGLLKLEKLDLSHNNISHLSELSLPPFPKLQSADFRENPIEVVFSNTYEIMNATTALIMGSEETALVIQSNSFLGLDSLRKLKLINIGLTILERELLRGMQKLKELEINGNIETLNFDAFLEVPKLENLVLQSCKISSISMDAFYGLYGLLYLDLSNNNLETLPPGLFDQQFSIKEILLQNNKLTELPLGIFNNLPAKMIRLEGNPWHCSCAMKDWQPAAINKIKQQIKEVCQFQYDKGSMCSQKSDVRYVYERRVAPRCETPTKYKHWSVFQVLRKELRCNKKLQNKTNRKDYLKKKHDDYEKSIKSDFQYLGNSFKKQSQGVLPVFINNNKKTEENNESKKREGGENVSSTGFYTQYLGVTSPKAPSLNNKQVDYSISPRNENNEDLAGELLTKEEKISNEMANVFQNNVNASKYKNYSEQELKINSINKTKENNILPNDLQENTEDLSNLPEAEYGLVHQEHRKDNFNKYLHMKAKKENQKLDQQNEKRETTEKTKTTGKQNLKPMYVVYNNNKPVKVSKKAWKLEMEKKRQTKLLKSKQN
uniref:Uncharacterized protein n=1 Tax=Timema monikensis TaxID=170555 RepID=A0A7R9ECL5_9NEOP|nr:unnamed protein product [Timema monikensis]